MKASGVIGEGLSSFPIVEEFEAKKKRFALRSTIEININRKPGSFSRETKVLIDCLQIFKRRKKKIEENKTKNKESDVSI